LVKEHPEVVDEAADPSDEIKREAHKATNEHTARCNSIAVSADDPQPDDGLARVLALGRDEEPPYDPADNERHNEQETVDKPGKDTLAAAAQHDGALWVEDERAVILAEEPFTERTLTPDANAGC